MVTWKKICAGMLSAALLTGAATTTFAAEEQSDKTVTLYNQPGAPLPEPRRQPRRLQLLCQLRRRLQQRPRRKWNWPISSSSISRLARWPLCATIRRWRCIRLARARLRRRRRLDDYKVIEKEVNPIWTDPGDPTNSIPSGPSNPLGYRWIGIGGNYGIHGTNRPDSVGHYVSNGCIRMHEEDVEKVFDMVEVGTPVEITYNRIVVEKTPDNQIAYYVYPDGYGWQNVTAADVEKWLAGYGVADFVNDADVEQKVAASDGTPNYVAKVYPLYVNGTKLKGKAVVQDDIVYLPAVELAQASKVSLGWKPEEKVLLSTYGQAVGYQKKDTLYCNSDDIGTLYHLDGGLDKEGKYVLKNQAAAVKTETAVKEAAVAETKAEGTVKAAETKAEAKAETAAKTAGQKAAAK